jgi:MFS family permease
MRRLLAIRDVRLYLTGQAFSLFGDLALWLAMGVWVKTLTHSNGAAGLVFFCFTAPTLLAPATGLLVDRVHRRRLLVAVNALAGGAVLLTLLVHDAADVWLIYVVMAIYGFAYCALSAAESALLTVMLPEDLLADANGALRAVQGTLRLVAPLAGAGLFAAVGAHAVALLDAGTFAAAIVCLLAMRVREPRLEPVERQWWAQATAGVRHIAATAALRRAVIACAVALLVFGFSETILFAIAGDGLRRPAAFVGVLVTVQGVGAVAGALSAPALVRRIGEARVIALGFVAAAAAALLELPSLLAPVLGGVVLFGASVPWCVVGITTLLQRRTPVALQGRVYAAADALITTPQALSIALGAGLAGVVGYRALLGAMAVVILAAAGYLVRPAGARASRPTSRAGLPRLRGEPRPGSVRR